jgi:hypothetical protein
MSQPANGLSTNKFCLSPVAVVLAGHIEAAVGNPPGRIDRKVPLGLAAFAEKRDAWLLHPARQACDVGTGERCTSARDQDFGLRHQLAIEDSFDQHA